MREPVPKCCFTQEFVAQSFSDLSENGDLSFAQLAQDRFILLSQLIVARNEALFDEHRNLDVDVVLMSCRHTLCPFRTMTLTRLRQMIRDFTGAGL